MSRKPRMRKNLRTSHIQAGGRAVALTTANAIVPDSGPQGSSPAGQWFGPLAAPNPAAPPEVRGRRWDFQVGVNQVQQPKGHEGVTFAELRALAYHYDIMRIVIETIKDKVSRQPWAIVPRDRKMKLVGPLEVLAKDIEARLRRPDRDNFWNEWIRTVLEDLLVLDAPAIHVRRTLDDSEVYSLDALDGGTIKRVVDDWGRTPEAPFAAYQQVLKGLPAVNYSRHELCYRPRNLHTNRMYGVSPVEQVMMTVNIAVRRQLWQLSYFTDGNIPDSLIGVPSTWTPDQIRQFQDWFDGVLTGNTAKRRGATFVPGEVAKSYTPTKEAEIFGGAEEWLARVVCFAFGVSPHWAVKSTNRAEAETHKDEAEEDGLGPYKGWVKNLIDSLIIDQWFSEDLEFEWLDDDELDPVKKSQVHKTYVDMGAISLDDVRDDLGKDPLGGEFAIPTRLGTTTPVALDEQLRQGEAKMALIPSTDTNEEEDEDGAPPAQPDDDEEAEKLAKFASADPTPLDRPVCRRRTKAMTRTLAAALSELGDDVAGQVQRALTAEGVTKVEHGDGKTNDERFAAVTSIALGAAEDGAADALARSISLRLDLSEIEEILAEIGDDLEDVATDAGRLALQRIAAAGVVDGGGTPLLGVGVDDVEDLFERVNDRAVTYARDRAAELVGRRVLANGDVIDNPNPSWAITDSTRNMVRDTIAGGLKENKGSAAIVDELQESYAFSRQRAETISRTEIAMANSEGAMVGYRQAAAIGVQLDKEWLLGAKPCGVCIANAAEGPIPMDQAFQSGHQNTPAHPLCRCATVPVVRMP